MPLKLKLWLGRFVDWDKKALRLFLLMLAICFLVATAIVVDLANNESTCDSECHRLIDETVKDIDVQRIVTEILDETE